MEDVCYNCGRRERLTPQKFLEEAARIKAYHIDSRALFLPFRIKEIEVVDIGPIRYLKGVFSNLNLISGENACGKSSIFAALKCALTSPRLDYMITYTGKKYSKKSMIRIKPEAPVEEITVRMNMGDQFADVRCVVIDDPMLFQRKEVFWPLAKFCEKRKIQFIAFGYPDDEHTAKKLGGSVLRLPKRKA